MDNIKEHLKILLTGAHLSGYSGGETYVRDLAFALFDLGHTPIVHTPEPGPIFDELQRRGIPAITELGKLADAPDVILGNTQEETVLALLHFPQTPAAFVCHARFAWLALAPRMTRIRQYVAVDANCYDGLICEQGIPAASTRILLNAVDMGRFQRRPPLPDKPKTAAVFSNNAMPEGYAEVIREACGRRGIALEIIGKGYGTQTASPQNELTRFDIVFARARCAQEALAVGCAVVLCDVPGLGPMVTTSNVDELWKSNLGWRLLRDSITPEGIATRLAQYDAANASQVCAHVREHADLKGLARDWVHTLQHTIHLHRSAAPVSAATELAELGAYVRSVALHGTYHQLYQSMLKADRDRIEQVSRADRVSRAYLEIEKQLHHSQASQAEMQLRMAQLEAEKQTLAEQRDSMAAKLEGRRHWVHKIFS